MEQIIVAFITGLTTGGLSCLAVQGGLLASSLAQQIEHDLGTGIKPNKANTALPILLFLFAKVTAYTLLGALLGLAGSFLTFDPITRAILLIAIGIFMVGNGLRLLNIHPVFRYFNIEPPKFITRSIRHTAKSGTEFLTPLFLGAMTVFIPCGITQAMMAAALGTGSPAIGAALMASFTLGTSPVFFLVAYLTTRIGARLESYFMRFVAVVVLVLGLMTFDSGLNLMGSPLSFASITRGMFPTSEVVAEPVQVVASAANAGSLQLKVANNGYFPATVHAKANESLTLDLVTDKTTSCSRDFVIPGLKFYQLLPETGKVTVNIPPQTPGTIMRFSCSMGMYSGQIMFD